MSGPVKHKEIIKAWVDGVAVQFKNGSTWLTMPGPSKVDVMPMFPAATEYRVKPKTVKTYTRRVLIRESNDNWVMITLNKYYVSQFNGGWDAYLSAAWGNRERVVLDNDWVEQEIEING